ncbi:MAG: hypothetical protein Q7T71_02830, partial [Herbiconiux sp.]|nr:hypothetical protein [Herbiconiux sp.]
PLDLRAVSTFVSVRGGSDLALHRDFLLAVAASGALEPADGVMCLTRVPIDASAASDLVEQRIGERVQLTPLVRSALELTTLAPGLTVSTLHDLLGLVRPGDDIGTVFEQLEELRLLEVVGPGHDPAARLSDGVLETVVARGIGRMRRRRYHAAVIEALESLPPSQLGPVELGALARASLELARPIDPMLMTRAAMLSFRAPDMTLSLAIAAAAVEQGGGFQAEMALAVAESQNGLSTEAVERLNRLVADARDDVERSQAVTGLAGLVTERAVDPDWALGLTHLAGAVVRDPSALPRLDTARALMLHALGDADGAAQLVEPALDQLEGASLVHALFVLAGATMLRGELTRSFETLDRGVELMRAAGVDPWSVTLIRAVALGFEGRIGEAFGIVREF